MPLKGPLRPGISNERVDQASQGGALRNGLLTPTRYEAAGSAGTLHFYINPHRGRAIRLLVLASVLIWACLEVVQGVDQATDAARARAVPARMPPTTSGCPARSYDSSQEN
jgi:hypothetical protein